MDKKNILIVISSLKHWGGAEKIATTIWNKLFEKWYNLNYLTFYNAEKKYDFFWNEFCLNEKLWKNFIINILKLFKRAYQIKKYCKKNKIDVCLSHMEESNFSNIISKLFFKNKSKIYVNSHISVDDWWLLYKFLIKSLYNKADKIITVSREASDIFVKKYWIKKNKIQTIYNAINVSEINDLKNKKIKLTFAKIFDNWKKTFINIWRLTYQKNQELLIKTFKKFNKKYTNTQLIILWEWDLRENLKNIIWDNKDIYLLWNQENPYNFLKKSDFFVFTSRYEWFWIVLIEAMSCWLPVISVDCKSWPKEIIKKNIRGFEEIKDVSLEEYGILVPLYDEVKYFEAMEKIFLDKRLQKKYIEKSLERFMDFDIEKIIKERLFILN